ncbi:MAG TPA: DUF4331 family protein [Chthoniobacterales bacterium]|jgi:hypothetical protein|nr:DUF4331 family protein [Chthoniobacterales bacterium]
MKNKILASLVAPLGVVFFLSLHTARGADHGDGPTASNDASADLNDIFLFLDPNDSSRVVFEMTMRGFIVPGEAVNFGIFDPKLVYRFLIEGSGDAVPDAMIDITFAPRTTTAAAQVATVRMDRGATKVFEFNAPATNPTLNPAPPAQVVTTDPASGVSFFAGEVDDPFFFDIPAFSRFVAAVRAGTPNPAAAFIRGRDSFAGYNTMSIALSVPKGLLPSANNVVGASAVSLRADPQLASNFRNMATRGQVDGGDKVLIGGVIISGSAPKRLLIRAIGSSSGVPGALANPKLMLYNSQAQIIATNDNWQDTQAPEIAATSLAPKDPLESAILATLQPGAYTAIVDGVNGGKGIALVETYDLDVAAVGGVLRQVDREGVPAVNVALTPFARKDEYNFASPQDDANGRFAADIVATLKALGTDDTNIGILAEVAVVHGDFLRLNLTTANTGPGGGNNSGAGFPNGRRLGDDVIDTLLFFIANQKVVPDNVNANDVPLKDSFPFFADAQQPRDAGIDDNTRN